MAQVESSFDEIELLELCLSIEEADSCDSLIVTTFHRFELLASCEELVDAACSTVDFESFQRAVIVAESEEFVIVRFHVVVGNVDLSFGRNFCKSTRN